MASASSRIAQSVAIALLLVALAWASASAQSPAPATAAPNVSPASAAASPDPGLQPGDPRSDGQGPGIVGEPLLVLVGILLIGVATVVATIVVARATGRA